MSRLIDADALIMAIPDTRADIFENCRNCTLLGKEYITDIINNTPTVDAEPIKHGKWERIDPNDHNDYRCECSNCKSNWVMEDEIDEYSYCWVCGAKMDEVEKDEID